MSRWLPLICLALMHMLVDTSALLISPLWPEIESTFALGMTALSIVFIFQSLPTSLSQGVFGYLRDRNSKLYLLWLGPVLAVVCLTLVGIAPNRIALCMLFIVGGVGVGAFHPEAAVAVGNLLPENRTRALSVFMFGGSLGLALGPTLSGAVVSRWGLSGLLYLTLPMLSMIPVLYWGGGLAKPSPKVKSAVSKIHPEVIQHGAGLAVFVLLICSLRLVPNMAMDKVLSFTLDQRGFDRFETGLVQSTFLVSASVGMFLMAVCFRSGWERRLMIACPILGIPLLCGLGLEGTPDWMILALLIPTGLVLWGTTPAMVSYAQQLFPKGVGLASAITMGLSWGLGGLIQAPITAYFRSTGSAQHAFFAFAPFLGLAALGAWLLPAVSSEKTAGSRPQNIPSSTVQPEPVDA